jgi:hypothetical protein
MSDFLTNLVERTVSPELVVRPKFISPYEQMPVVQIAFEQNEEGLEENFKEESRVVDSTEHREPSFIPPQFEPEARHEEAQRESHIDFEVVKPHPTVRSDDEELPGEHRIEVSKDQKTPTFDSNLQATTLESPRSHIRKPLGVLPRTVLKLERQPTRASRIAESFRNLNDESPLDQRDDSPAATPSSVTIRIGRVEVRATTASQGIERRPSSRPQSVSRPSLDEYLERRSKRR